MRVKNSPKTRARRKDWKNRAEGSWGTRHTTFKTARQTVVRASQYALRDRRNKKRDFRKLWIARINAAVREEGFTYSQFINALTKQKIEINRKMLSELAINNRPEFNAIVKMAMGKK